VREKPGLVTSMVVMEKAGMTDDPCKGKKRKKQETRCKRRK
jgi:hypothetical protein